MKRPARSFVSEAPTGVRKSLREIAKQRGPLPALSFGLPLPLPVIPKAPKAKGRGKRGRR